MWRRFRHLRDHDVLSCICILQIAALEPGGDTYKDKFDSLFKVFMAQLQSILPAGTNIPEAYSHGSEEDQAFVSNLAQFFTAFFKVTLPSSQSSGSSGTGKDPDNVPVWHWGG